MKPLVSCASALIDTNATHKKIKEHPIKTKRKRKRFTPEFKAKVVIEALNVESSEAEICRRHNTTEAQLLQWKRQLLENAATLFEPNRKQPDYLYGTHCTTGATRWQVDAGSGHRKKGT